MRNCLTYAVGMYFRHGGYIRMRRSLLVKLHGLGPRHVFNLVPHFLHESKDGKITQLVRTDEENALAKKRGPWFDWFWLWKFAGRIVEGDVNYLESDLK